MESEEVVNTKKRSNCNAFASYFGSDSRSSNSFHPDEMSDNRRCFLDGRELSLLSVSSTSDGYLDDNVRPVTSVLVYVPENVDIKH